MTFSMHRLGAPLSAIALGLATLYPAQAQARAPESFTEAEVIALMEIGNVELQYESIEIDGLTARIEKPRSDFEFSFEAPGPDHAAVEEIEEAVEEAEEAIEADSDKDEKKTGDMKSAEENKEDPELETVDVSIKISWSSDWVEIQRDAQDENRYTFHYADAQRVVVHLPEEAKEEGAPEEIGVTMQSEDLVIGLERAGETLNYDLAAASLALMLDEIDTPEVKMAFSLRYDDISGETSYPADFDIKNLEAFEGSYSLKAGAMHMAVAAEPGPEADANPGDALTMEMRSGESSGSGVIGDGRVSGDSNMRDLEMAISAPMPLNFKVGGIAAVVDYPTGASDEPQSFILDYDLENIEIDEFLWSMVDPQGALEHSIERLRIAVEMDMIMRMSMLNPDPTAMDRMMEKGIEPFEPQSVTMRDIRLEALGAGLQAEGKMENLMAPVPSGDVRLVLTDWRPLLDSLVELGVAPQAQAMMVRGMMEQFEKEDPATGGSLFEISMQDGMPVINGVPLGGPQ